MLVAVVLAVPMVALVVAAVVVAEDVVDVAVVVDVEVVVVAVDVVNQLDRGKTVEVLVSLRLPDIGSSL